MVSTDGTVYVEEESRTIVNNVITSDSLFLLGIPTSGGDTYTLLSTTAAGAELCLLILPRRSAFRLHGQGEEE